jgi:glucans biosynthesis protein C
VGLRLRVGRKTGMEKGTLKENRRSGNRLVLLTITLDPPIPPHPSSRKRPKARLNFLSVTDFLEVVTRYLSASVPFRQSNTVTTLATRGKIDEMTAADPVGKAARRYDLDWLRVLIILFVFVYHVGLIFRDGWYISADWTHEMVGYALAFTSFLRMPVLFFISGCGTWFVLKRRRVRQFLSERSQRLLVPFAVSLILLVPVQNYIKHRFWAEASGNAQPTFVEVYTRLFPTIHQEWGHLWFLAYLILYSALAAPLFRFLLSSRGRAWLDGSLSILDRRGGVFLFALPLIFVEWSLRWKWPGHINLVDDWAEFTLFFILFLLGFMLVGSLRFWAAVDRTRPMAIGITIALCVMLPVVRFRFNQFPSHFTDLNYTLIQIAMGLLGWSSLLVVLGLAKRYLAFENGILRYSREASYPFFLLHHPVVVVVGFWVVGLQWHPGLQFLVIAGSSLVITLALYEIVLRRINLIRLAFGLKPVRHPYGSEKKADDVLLQRVGG